MAVSESDYVTITLTPKQVRWCDAWAGWRQENADRVKLRGHNNASNDPLIAEWYHILGYRGELAGFLVLNALDPAMTWSRKANVDAVGNKIADYDAFVDAKTAGQDLHGMPVQRYDPESKKKNKGDPPEWAYLFILGHEHPKYTVVGWCWGKEAQAAVPLTDPLGKERHAHFITKDNPILKPISELVAEMRERRRMKRAGFVGYDENGHFVHYCKCGAWGGKSVGAHITKGQLGEWFCPEHFPQQPGEEERGRWR